MIGFYKLNTGNDVLDLLNDHGAVTTIGLNHTHTDLYQVSFSPGHSVSPTITELVPQYTNFEVKETRAVWDVNTI